MANDDQRRLTATTFAARGEQIRLVPTWRGIFDTSLAGEVLLPGDDARLGGVSFDDGVAPPELMRCRACSEHLARADVRTQRRSAVSRSMCDSFSGLRTA